MKISKTWYKSFYDKSLAMMQIDSKNMHRSAKKEVDFLASKIKLKRGMNVIDVPCGTGRHSKTLAKKGLKVTAMDINKDCLDLAKKNTKGSDIKFYRYDMGNLLNYRIQYDAVINMFTSIVYFSNDRTNFKVLKVLVPRVKSGGKLCIYAINRDCIL